MPKNLKTLHLTNAYYEQSGGIATFYRALMEAANREGREMCLVVPGAEERLERVGEHGRIYHLRAPQAPLNSRYRILYPWQFLLPGSRIQAILKAERPDVVEICDKYNLNYLAAVLRLGLLEKIDFHPLVLGLSCERMDENFATYLGENRLQRWFCRWYMHWIYFPFFDHHIANSAHTAEELVRASANHTVQRGVWIRPMGVDVEGLSPARRSAGKRAAILGKAGLPQDSVALLYVGRLAPEKNLPLLVETLAALREEGRKDYRLLIAGDGIERERLEHLAAGRAPGAVVFMGHMSDRGQLADLYANCDVFVHPNPREPFGIAPLEAMASGLPLVAPNAGGVISFANERNAAVVPAAAEAFAAAIEGLMADRASRERKAAEALITAASYSWRNATAAYLDIYSALHAKFADEAAETPIADYWSTPAPPASGALIAASAAAAKAGFRFFQRYFAPRIARARTSAERPVPAEIEAESALAQGGKSRPL